MISASVSMIKSIRGAVVANQLLLSNAGMLALGTASTAALGFVYWWYAARTFSPEAVGYAAAAISLMNLLAHVGEVGLGPYLMGNLGEGRRRGSLVAAGLTVAGMASLAIGLGFVALSGLFGQSLGRVTDTPDTAIVFAMGCTLTALTLVLDQAFVGMLLSVMQLVRNLVFAAAKLLFLVIVGLVASSSDEFTIFSTWIAGQILSMSLIAAWLRRANGRILHRPDIAALQPALRQVLGHHALSIAIQTPGLLLPFLVTMVLSPDVNAAFYAAWTILNVAFLVPASLASVLYSLASRAPEQFAQRVRLSLCLSMASGAMASLIFYFGSSPLLGLFNGQYPALAGDGLRFIGLGALGIAIKYHYLAIKRASGDLERATSILVVGVALELAAAMVGAKYDGLAGLANGWVLAMLLQAAVLLPEVLRAAASPAALYFPPQRTAGPRP